MRKKGFAQRLGDFMEGKGFYIVLSLCVAVIGISGYLLFRSMSFSPAGPDDSGLTPVDGGAVVVVTPTPTATPAATPSPTPAPSSAPAPTPAPAATIDEAEEAMAAPTVFVWPVQGSVVAAFSPDTLVRNETMGDWRTHEGVDLAAAPGTQVLAAAAGTVDSVLEDPLLGTTVTIVHGGDLTSVYANLQSVPTVQAGDEVSAGDVIGAVGTTAAGEQAGSPHLHFAMYQNGEPADPAEYLPD